MTVQFDITTVPIEDRDRVKALIPNPRIAEGYVHRTIDGFDDFDLFDVATEEAENILLEGPTGSSKTTAFRAYAAARGLPFVIVDFSATLDPSLILGRTVPDGDGFRYAYGNFSLVVKYGGVVLFDECNMAHGRVGAAYHQLLAVTRRIDIPEAGENIQAGRGGCEQDEDGEWLSDAQPTLFAAAYNNGYQGVVVLNEAFRNRFQMPFDWGYDPNVEAALIDSPRLREMAENMRSLGEVRTPVSTNMLIEFVRHAQRVGMTLANRFFLNHFPADERGPIRRALGANGAAIAAELGVDAPDAVEEVNDLVGEPF